MRSPPEDSIARRSGGGQCQQGQKSPSFEPRKPQVRQAFAEIFLPLNYLLLPYYVMKCYNSHARSRAVGNTWEEVTLMMLGIIIYITTMVPTSLLAQLVRYGQFLVSFVLNSAKK
jgi:hypothetical protein